jgi:hypothetical protein
MPDAAPLIICHDCQRSNTGRCWRHQNAALVNQRPAPTPSTFDPMEAWKARGRELNAIYTALGRVVRDRLGESGPANGRYERDAVADIEALGARIGALEEQLAALSPGDQDA